jgi:hypothetical protein
MKKLTTIDWLTIGNIILWCLMLVLILVKQT